MFSNLNQSSVDLIHSDITSNLNLENGMELSPENSILPDELYDLGLEAYEPNELVFEAVQDLELFFEDESNCKCRKKKDKICFKKIGLKNFLERQFQLKGLEDNQLDLCIKTQLMAFKLNDDETERDTYNYQYNSSIPI
jgi:hypothetical protein